MSITQLDISLESFYNPRSDKYKTIVVALQFWNRNSFEVEYQS